MSTNRIVVGVTYFAGRKVPCPTCLKEMNLRNKKARFASIINCPDCKTRFEIEVIADLGEGNDPDGFATHEAAKRAAARRPEVILLETLWGRFHDKEREKNRRM